MGSLKRIITVSTGKHKPYFLKAAKSGPVRPFHPVCIGEAIELAKQRMDQKNVYFTNPAFDK